MALSPSLHSLCYRYTVCMIVGYFVVIVVVVVVGGGDRGRGGPIMMVCLVLPSTQAHQERGEVRT